MAGKLKQPFRIYLLAELFIGGRVNEERNAPASPTEDDERDEDRDVICGVPAQWQPDGDDKPHEND